MKPPAVINDYIKNHKNILYEYVFIGYLIGIGIGIGIMIPVVYILNL